MNGLDWNDIQYFVCLVHEQTLTATAEKLAVQHSTVARRINSLELTLNVTLFDRIGKRYHLTAEGKLLFLQATHIQSNIDSFSRIAGGQNTIQGTVTISAPPMLANKWIVPHISDFYQKYPQISLNLQGDTHISNLAKQEADIAIRLGRPTIDYLVIRKVGNINYQLYCHDDFFNNLTQGEVLQKSKKLVELQSNETIFAWTKTLQEQHDLEVIFSSNDLYICHNAIKKGLGIGVLPSLITHQSTDITALNTLPFLSQYKHSLPTALFEKKEIELYLVIHEDMRRSPKVRIVLDWLISLLSTKFGVFDEN